ncbi:MAG: helix-turn-helix transcriptional regulator [Candidatus Aminicenantes bacterium]|nr:helix-turn-helix transcriptional regulator [Candidatus Aminicenantes bacterium]
MNKTCRGRKTGTGDAGAAAEAARFFKALAHPARVHLAIRLLRGDCCVSEAGAVLDISQPNVSQHLKILKDAGIISGRRQGAKICYSLADPRLARILRILLFEENDR